MNSKYQEWIDNYLKRINRIPLGQCERATKQMVEDFPELIIVKGHVHTDYGKRAHCWLIDADQNIVDPTESQFTIIYEYEAWKPGDPVMAGRCMNCGNSIWVEVQDLDHTPYCGHTCSKECSQKLIAYYKVQPY